MTVTNEQLIEQIDTIGQTALEWKERALKAEAERDDLARNIAGIDARYLHTSNDVLLRAARGWIEQARAILSDNGEADLK
jgi:hypothetical protein